MTGAPSDWLVTLAAIEGGDRVALVRITALITGHLSRYGAYRFRDSWEDVVQDVLFKLIKSHRSGAIREPRAFASYVGTVTRNAFNDSVRSYGKPGAAGTAGESDFAALAAPEEIDRGLRLDLSRVIAETSERTRRVLEALYLEGMTYQEAASRLDIPLGTLKRIQTEGLKEIRGRMELSFEKDRSESAGIAVK